MSPQLMVGFGVDAMLMLATVLLLTQPGPIFRSKTEAARQVTSVLGVVLLFVTFLWSILLGCVMTLSEIAIQI